MKCVVKHNFQIDMRFYYVTKCELQPSPLTPLHMSGSRRKRLGDHPLTPLLSMTLKKLPPPQDVDVFDIHSRDGVGRNFMSETCGWICTCGGPFIRETFQLPTKYGLPSLLYTITHEDAGEKSCPLSWVLPYFVNLQKCAILKMTDPAHLLYCCVIYVSFGKIGGYHPHILLLSGNCGIMHTFTKILYRFTQCIYHAHAETLVTPRCRWNAKHKVQELPWSVWTDQVTIYTIPQISNTRKFAYKQESGCRSKCQFFQNSCQMCTQYYSFRWRGLYIIQSENKITSENHFRYILSVLATICISWQVWFAHLSPRWLQKVSLSQDFSEKVHPPSGYLWKKLPHTRCRPSIFY